MSKIPANRKAPPPDRPLNVGGSGIHFPSQIKTKTPDWNFWRGMRKVLHWQACALSVGADPDTMGRRPGDSVWSYDAHHLDQLPKSSQETLKKRLRLLAANRYEPTIFTLPMVQYSGLNTGEVFLSEFAAWGVSLGWGDMPQELAAMAQEQAVIAPKVAPVAEPPPQSATHERFARLRFSELWSEGELLSIMCGDARRLFGSGPSASDSERDEARGAIWDGMTVESLCVADVRQVESGELMVPPETVRYFKPQQAIAWVNRDRFPKFPFPVSEAAPPVSTQQAPASEPVVPAAALTLPPAEGITKQQVLIAFEALVKPFNLKKALENGKGLYGETAPGSARTQKGTPGAKHAALWNPVILAVGLRDKHSVSMLHLKHAFKDHTFLRSWADEWRSALDSLGE